MKKIYFSFVFLLLTIVLIACGGNGATESGEEAEEVVTVGDNIEGASELTFWTFAGTHADFFEDAAIRWNEEFPDNPIQFTAETYPFDQMHNNLTLALQSGQGAPDMVDIEIARFPNFLQGEIQLEPLNDLIEPEIDNFITERLDMYSHEGQYYGAPTHLGATVVYYNTAIMEEAGVDIDKIITWDDYVEAGIQVTENTGVPMTTIAENWYGIWPFVRQSGSDFFDDNGDLTLDSAENIEALQFVADLVIEHEIADVTPGGHYHSEEFFGFMNGGGQASLIAPTFYMNEFMVNMEDLDGNIEMRPLPEWPGSDTRSVAMGGTGTTVTNQAEDVELAKDFLAYAKLTEEGNIALWTQLGFDPPRWDVWDSEEIREDNDFYRYFHDDIFDILLDIRDDVVGVHMTPYTPDVLEEIDSNIMFNVLRQQSQTPEEALQQATESVRAIMD
ncbi:ABC transporter substrate-binding protein [Amphibacillus cookii]|uniref:ABC transporter substrate-binding protein n=1 Tax=Amphibacillus cookii TaxID=767787 RepID=UPI0019583F6B|nr:extracellular solute-binding protein [Amphibacillus cookii]MBM7540935.1 arabinosaccharide transport system substrate-binding protein [Amphibacillus cookii]